MMRLTRHTVFRLLTVLFVVIFLETVLNLLVLTSNRVKSLLASPWAPIAVYDEHLKYRPNPGFPEHDRNGFRNPAVPARADVVALGDSQTYGTGVNPEEAWPRQLENMLGKPVYGMAFGGYGPVHSVILLDEAVAFHPGVIIEALYSGNDLVDAFNIVYNGHQLPELKSPDPQVQSTVRTLEDTDPITVHVSRLFHMGKTQIPSAKTPADTASSPIAFLSRHSRLYGLLRRIGYELSHRQKQASDPWERAKAYAKKHPQYAQICNTGPYKTVLLSEYRSAALDLRDPRIAEGWKIALRSLERMNKITAAEKIRFIVLLIPTKELVFQDVCNNLGASAYHRLIENEIAFWDLTKTYLERHEIEYIDALPALRNQLRSGVQPYQVSTDGHPNTYGHKAIAAVVDDYLTR